MLLKQAFFDSLYRSINISTVDVFKNLIGVDCDAPIDKPGLNANNLHYRLLKKFKDIHTTNHLSFAYLQVKIGTKFFHA